MNISTKVMAISALLLSQSATAMLVNGSFESPDLGDTPKFSLSNPVSVPGWSTTDNAIEIWANGFGGVTSYEGTQHAEINANKVGTLYQDIFGIDAGSIIGFEFAHRARVGQDTMQFSITDLGPDGMLGGGNDTRLFKDKFTADTSAWVLNSGLSLAALGNTLRFAYSAVSTGSGNGSVGNFLDAANFRIEGDTGQVPEPSIITLFGIGLLGLGFARRRIQS